LEVKTVLNRIQHFAGFVSGFARWSGFRLGAGGRFFSAGGDPAVGVPGPWFLDKAPRQARWVANFGGLGFQAF
jgi:hypothetical protein